MFLEFTLYMYNIFINLKVVCYFSKKDTVTDTLGIKLAPPTVHTAHCGRSTLDGTLILNNNLAVGNG